MFLGFRDAAFGFGCRVEKGKKVQEILICLQDTILTGSNKTEVKSV